MQGRVEYESAMDATDTPRWTFTLVPSEKGARMQISTDIPGVPAAEVVHHLLQAAVTLNQNPMGVLMTRAQVDAEERRQQVLKESPATSCWAKGDTAFWLGKNAVDLLESALVSGGWNRVPVDPAGHACDYALRPDDVRNALAE